MLVQKAVGNLLLAKILMKQHNFWPMYELFRHRCETTQRSLVTRTVLTGA